jgi:putative ABC transport system substrate-binding protein
VRLRPALLLALGIGSTLVFGVVTTVEAQQSGKVYRIGVVDSVSGPGPVLEAFRQELRKYGYIEGQNILIDYRWAGDQRERLPQLAAELVSLPVDVILAPTPPAYRAASKATRTIPIVFVFGGVAEGGIVASLARPGGNITGLSESYGDLVPKWLELLKEAVPQASRVGVLTMPPLWPVQSRSWAALQQAAETMRVTLHRVEVHEPSAFASAFAGMTREHIEALIVLPHPLLFRHRTRLVALAAERQLPTIWGPFREFVEAGGLMAYGPSLRDQYRRAAYFVDKILKGAKPADLQVEQPTKFELEINLKTAKPSA